MGAVFRSFVLSIWVPPRAAAVAIAVSLVVIFFPMYFERTVGRAIDVSWLYGVNLVVVYCLQIAPILFCGIFALGRPQPFPRHPPRVRFLCLVPAYNEERVIHNSVGCLLGQDYPRDLYDVVVISDGSTDGTEAVSQALGARVLRTGVGGTGKHRALGFAFDRLLEGPQDARYVCIVDADNRVDPNFLQEMNNAICAGGFRCLQAFHDVLNGPLNWITKSLWITTLASSRLYNYGRFRGFGNALICGTGWCCEARLVQRYWSLIQTQTEDIELNGLLLLHEGIGVPWVTAAHIYDEKPYNLWVAIRQRHRWMTGHMRAAGLLFWPCLREGIRRRDVRLVELALYYLLPFVMNLSNVQVLLLSGIQFGVLAVHGPLALPAVQWCLNGLTLVYLFGYQVAGFAWVTGLWWRAALYSVYAALAGFLVWTPALVWACFTVFRKDWIFHTPHIGARDRGLSLPRASLES